MERSIPIFKTLTSLINKRFPEILRAMGNLLVWWNIADPETGLKSDLFRAGGNRSQSKLQCSER